MAYGGVAHRFKARMRLVKALINDVAALAGRDPLDHQPSHHEVAAWCIMTGMVDGSRCRFAWRASVVTGFVTIGLAAWTAVAVWLNAFFVDDILGTFYDPQGYEQERDALRRAAVALYTAGDHVGHGLAVFVGVALGLRQTSLRATLVITAAAGLVLATGQGVMAAILTVPRLRQWDEGGDYSFPTTMLGDLVVLVPVLVCLMLYPLLAMLGGPLGLYRNGARWLPLRVQLAAVGLWSLAGPFYLLALDSGPPSGAAAWAAAMACWLVPLGCCLMLTLKVMSAVTPTDGAPDGGTLPSPVPR
jgi:hypothetical protein